MSMTKHTIEKEESYRKLSIEILSQLNVIKVHERGDYYWQLTTLTDDLLNESINLAKKESQNLDAEVFKAILLDVYKEAGIEDGDKHFDKCN